MSLLLLFGSGGGGGGPVTKKLGSVYVRRTTLRPGRRPTMLVVGPTMLVGRNAYGVPVAPATFTVTGQDVTLRLGRSVVVSPASVTLTLNPVTLTKSGSGSYTLTVSPANYSVTGQSVGLRVTRRLSVTPTSVTLTLNPVTLTYSGALQTLAQYLIDDHSTGRYAITEDPLMATTTTTASRYIWLTEDQEFEVELSRRNATTGDLEAASGLTGLAFTLATTPGGAAIGGMSFSATERGSTGIYAAVADLATLQAGLDASTYPDGTAVYLVLTKSGDIASRSWRKIIRRQRVGDG